VPRGAPQVLGGPVWWLAMGVYILTAALGLFVFIDSVRPAGRSRFDAVREPWWVYTASEAVYLCLLFGVWIPKVPRALSAIPVLLTPFALALGVAYLLRVVYPKPVAETAAESGEGAVASDEVSSAEGDAEHATSSFADTPGVTRRALP